MKGLLAWSAVYIGLWVLIWILFPDFDPTVFEVFVPVLVWGAANRVEEMVDG